MALHKARNPGLWLPHRAPIGRARVDWSHPLAAGLTSYFLPSHGAHDLCGNVRSGSFINGAKVGIGGRGPEFQFTKASSHRIELPASDAYYTASQTIGVIATQNAQEAGSPFGRWFMDGKWGFRYTCPINVIAVGIGRSGGDIGGFGDYRTDGFPHKWGGVLSVDGVAGSFSNHLLGDWGEEYGTSGGHTFVLSTAPMGIGATYNGGSYDEHWNGSVHVAATWSRPLSRAESSLFLREPYCVLVPAA